MTTQPHQLAGASHPAAQQLLADVRAYRRCSDDISEELADELIQVLGEAATELWNIDPQHVTLARLRAVRRRVEEARRT